ncbi:MAG: penicillin-binding transpeptidase domain-containing protein [Eubacteriales bacterium]
MNSRKLAFRCIGFLLAASCFFFGLGSTLYTAQVINGAQYTATSQRKIPETETVEVSRGMILDRYGRVLVQNTISYQVDFNTSLLGSGTTRGDTLDTLIQIAKEEGVEWKDDLPVSTTYPYEYSKVGDIFFYLQSDDQGASIPTLTNLGKLAVSMKWITDPTNSEGAVLPTATELLEKMSVSFGLWDPKAETNPPINREVLGILYHLYLRSRDVSYTEYIFASDVSIEFTAKVKENGLLGININPITEREYMTEYAAHLLGRVTPMDANQWEYYSTLGYQMDDHVGKEGAELAFESYLRGESGVRELERDTQGTIMSSFWREEAQPGSNVVLTLDIDLQKKTEDTLADMMERLASDSLGGAAATVIAVDSGEILAAASYPTFNLALYGQQYQENVQNELKPLFNRSLFGAYPPGSTFKMVTGIAGLEEGIVSPTDRILDNGRYSYYVSNGPACWIYNQNGGSHGWQTVSDAIKNSCNYYFYEVGRKLGITRISNYASMFGLGESTGVELPESKGVMAGPEYTQSMGGTWYDGATLSVAIGQESSQFTPLQLSNYIATLVNGGTRYEAHLLKEVKSSDFSTVEYVQEPVVSSSLDLAEENMEAVKLGMKSLVESGSVSAAFYDLRTMGIDAGAKTGTAQLTSVSSGSANAVFVCFAPFDDPEIAISMVVESGGSGIDLARATAEIMEYYFNTEDSRDLIHAENTLLP